jgi:ParB family chromosome partitioning protein
MKEEIILIPIDQIRILNPRHRDRKKFAVMIDSIKNLGLKKPIKVSIRSTRKDNERPYDLVCGQGRIEAFQVLGYTEIPAIVADLPKEERLLMSLVENIARRFSSPLDLINEIERLKSLGYSNRAISKKLDITDNTIGGLLALKGAGEERLLEAALRGTIPLGVAIDIAKTDGADSQRELLKAYENKQLGQRGIRAVRRLIEQRRFLGKSRSTKTVSKSRTSADGFVSAYRRESQRQKALVQKAKLCDAKLLILVTAFTKMLRDENFINLLRAEKLLTVPKFLADKLHGTFKEAA